MKILGLNHGEINSSSALVSDGKVVAGSPEERFSRVKRTKEFPIKSLQYCLNSNNLQLENCDYVAQAWNPGEYWRKYNSVLSSFRIKREDYFYTICDNLYQITDRTPPEWTLLNSENKKMPPIYFVRHHLAHAANAFFLSSFDKAAILTCDLRGEFETTTLGLGEGNEINILDKNKIPHSLGLFYAAFTQLLGYQPDGDEWKVMALSAYDVDNNKIYENIKKTVRLIDDGLFELDQSFYNDGTQSEATLYTNKLKKLLGDRLGEKGETPTEWHHSIAKAMQTVAEEIIFHILKTLYEKTKCDNLVLGGGFFMNSVCNGKIIDRTPFKKIYISFAPSDVGNSIGAALYVAHCIHHEKRDFNFHSSHIGPSFNEIAIEKSLIRRKISYQKFENIEKEIASILSNGEIIAVFNGKMEFGERALGNRSILGDPRKIETKDKINSIIKYRESYRPFAPAVLFEKAYLIFEIPENYECNYMEKVVPVKKEFYNKLPAITHVDGSGRIQTVKKEQKMFYDIISEFEKISGFPVVLNTSFNINGEPIVLSPDDALNTFFNSGLENLAINSFLIKK